MHERSRGRFLFTPNTKCDKRKDFDDFMGVWNMLEPKNPTKEYL
jgi:hypothetical protein